MVRISMRSYFSTYHFWGASHFAEMAGNIEAASTERKFHIEQRAYVMAAVIESAAFLESVINELCKDCNDGYAGYLEGLRSGSVSAISSAWVEWHSGARRPNTLEKFQKVLGLAGGEKFDKGRPHYQEATLVLKLRNALVHYKPESLSSDDPHELGDVLKPRFAPNAIMEGAGNPYFPDHCLGAGCAKWAVDAARNFADEFFSRLGIKPNYQISGFLNSS